jgi:HEAT repeats
MAILSKHKVGIAAACVFGLAVSQMGAQAPVPAPAPPAGVLAPPAASSARDAQERGPQVLSPEAIQSSIDALGSVDAAASGAAFAVRMNAARALRRGAADAVAAALVHAVESHRDPYVRFRALVLLTAFNDSRTAGVVREILPNPNDRLRTVAYGYYEHHPDPSMVPELLQALDREESEFVRPALIRALAAHGSDWRVRDTLLKEVGHGQDYFRSGVIEALGDYRATYAIQPLLEIARLGGPLQIDAVIALGKLKDVRAMETLATLQRSAPRDTQPAIEAAICLLGVNCDAHMTYLLETLKFANSNPGFQELLRNTVLGLVALAETGNVQALSGLLDVGIPSVDPPRAPIALGIGTVAIRNASLMLSVLETYPKRDAAIDLVAEGFDMLEEDYEEEGFFAAVRKGYWQAAEGSATRRLDQALIDKLEF